MNPPVDRRYRDAFRDGTKARLLAGARDVC